MNETKYFIHLQFFGMNPEFSSLPAADKDAGRKKFLTTYAALEPRFTLLTYSLSGIRSDCDWLLLSIGEQLDLLQSNLKLLMATGVGKYLTPAYAYTAISQRKLETLGGAEYLFVCPWGRTRDWHKLKAEQRLERTNQERALIESKPSLKLHTVKSFRSEGDESILLCETNQPRDFLDIVRELKGTPIAYFLPVASTFLGVKKNIKDIVEGLG